MNVKKAYKILMTEMNGLRVSSCYEYDTLFVFNTLSEDGDDTDNAFSHALYSVNKSTGEVKHFLPMNIPIEEYNNGKQVNDFK